MHMSRYTIVITDSFSHLRALRLECVLPGMLTTPDVTNSASPLVATAVAQAFGLFAAVLIAADVSGGHVNPAVTFAYAIGGHIGVPSAIFYWASQLLGATMACLSLNLFSAGEVCRRNRSRSLPF